MDVIWSMLVFFAFFAWIWIAVTLFSDIFRRHDIGGMHKAVWVIFIIVVPFLGVLVYLIAQHDGLRDRTLEAAKAQQSAFDDAVREAAGGSGAAAEIAKGKELLDSGAISQADFEALKAKALA
jgi:uncharacterized membrane protein YcjF (UPF0283 family)